MIEGKRVNRSSSSLKFLTLIFGRIEIHANNLCERVSHALMRCALERQLNAELRLESNEREYL